MPQIINAKPLVSQRKPKVGQTKDFTPKARRRFQTRLFQARVLLALLLMIVAGYFAWFSPWSKPVRNFELRRGTAVGGP